MNRKFKKGDLVILNLEKILEYRRHIPNWYSTATYKIIDISYEIDLAHLEPDFPFPDINHNTISPDFLMSTLSIERKKKLKQLNKKYK